MAFAGNLVVNLSAKTDKFRSNMNRARREAKQTAAEFKRLGNRIAAATGLAMAAGTVIAVRKLAEFDDAIRATGAIASATDAEFAALSETALRLGKTTSFTSAEVAGLMTELARGGIKPDEINNMTDAVLDLARATGTEAAMSAEIMATTLNQFSLGAADATHVADVFTTAANSTLNTVEKLGEAMKFAAPVAQDLGMSLESTAAIVATLGNVGIQGTMAGAAIRRLGAVTAAEADRMESVFGIAFKDAAGEVLPLIDMLENVNKATAGLTRGARMAKMKEAFGLLGITAAANLGKAAGSAKDLTDKLNDIQVTAKETAIKMDAGIGGSIRRMMSALDGLAIALGSKLEPTFRNITELITKASLNLDSWLSVVIKLGSALVAVAAAMKTLAFATRAYAMAMILAKGVSGGSKTWLQLTVGLAAAAGGMMLADAALQDFESDLGAAPAELKEYEVRMATATEATEAFGETAEVTASRFTAAYVAMLPPIKTVTRALVDTERAAAIWKHQGELLDDFGQSLQDLRTPAEVAAQDLAKFTKQVRLFVVPGDQQTMINKFIDDQSGFSAAMQSALDELAVLRGSVTETDLMLQEMGSKGASTQQLEELRAVLDEIDKAEKQKKEAQIVKGRQLAPSQQRGSTEALTTILRAQQNNARSPEVQEQEETNEILRGMAAVMERQENRNTARPVQGAIS